MSMSFVQVWEQLSVKQPKLSNSDATVEIKVDSFRMLLRQVYEQGQKNPTRSDSGIRFDDLFGDMFRKKP